MMKNWYRSNWVRMWRIKSEEDLTEKPKGGKTSKNRGVTKNPSVDEEAEKEI